LAAGRFLPWLERFGWMARLDALMLERVLKHLPRHHAALALNLSAATLADPRPCSASSRCWAAPRTGAAADLRRAVAEQAVLEQLTRRLHGLGFSLALQRLAGASA
jgi:EAL domain-containing protein (putative c-di-GMP-specific phosphodiesterase class I)